MDKLFTFLYFGFFLIGFIIILKILISSNFEKLFKKGKIGEIRIAYFVTAFILASLFSFSMVKIVEVIYSIILK